MSTESLIAARGGSLHEHRKATRKMRWWYEALADFMISHPRATQNEIGAYFGRQACTISTIVNTDAFKAYFRQRRDEHAQVLDASVRNKLMNVADKSLDMMIEHLDKKRDTIPLEGLQRNLETTLKSLGYGAATSSPVAVTINNSAPPMIPVTVSLQDLEAAREALRRNQMRTINPEPPSAPEISDDSCD